MSRRFQVVAFALVALSSTTGATLASAERSELSYFADAAGQATATSDENSGAVCVDQWPIALPVEPDEDVFSVTSSIASQIEFIETKKMQLVAMVNLYQALGGGGK